MILIKNLNKTLSFMENQNEQLHGVEVEEESPVTVETEDVDSTEETTDEVTISKSELNKLKRKAIAYDASKKEVKTDVVEKKEVPQNTSNGLSREEAMLIAKGYDEEDLDNLNAIAKGKGIDLKTAQEDVIFKAYLEKKQKERKSEQARLSSSKGSTTSQTNLLKATPGMTEEEHKALFFKRLGR